MYYTTSGVYRKSKMLIDYANIALTFAIGVVFIIILFLRSGSGILSVSYTHLTLPTNSLV